MKDNTMKAKIIDTSPMVQHALMKAGYAHYDLIKKKMGQMGFKSFQVQVLLDNEDLQNNPIISLEKAIERIVPDEKGLVSHHFVANF